MINRRAPERAPFFLTVAPLAPHREFDRRLSRSDPPHAIWGSTDVLPLPRPPNFNEADVSDKPPSIRNLPRLTAEEISAITTSYRREAEALQAVDEMVERIYRAVEASGELNNTVIVFTSDNGFFHGEHRVPKGKSGCTTSRYGCPLVAGPGFTAASPPTPSSTPTSRRPSSRCPARRRAGSWTVDRCSTATVLARSCSRHSTPSPVLRGAVRPLGLGRVPNGEQELYDMIATPTSSRAGTRIPASRTSARTLRTSSPS